MNDSQNNADDTMKPMTREEILKNHQPKTIPKDRVAQLFKEIYAKHKDVFDELAKR